MGGENPVIMPVSAQRLTEDAVVTVEGHLGCVRCLRGNPGWGEGEVLCHPFENKNLKANVF